MRLKRLLWVILLAFISMGFVLGQSINQLMLINADTDQDILVLTDGIVLDLTEIGRNLNVRAETSGNIGSVRFALDGNANFQTENVAPYALNGDTNGDYRAWTPSIGNHTLTASAFSGGSGNGTLLGSITVNFTVTEEEGMIEMPQDPGTGVVTFGGELKKWHKVTLSFDGPGYRETSVSPNPFLDYRLEVTFTNGNQSYRVPGYFAADGKEIAGIQGSRAEK